MAKDEQKVRLKARIKALKYFRLVRGPGGGMADHPDYLVLNLKAYTHEDVEQIFTALNAAVRPLPLAESANGFGHLHFTERLGDGTPDSAAASLPSGEFEVWGVRLFAFKTPGRLELRVVDAAESYRITMSSVEAAHAVEPRFTQLADRIVDKPGPRAGLFDGLKTWWKRRTGSGS